MVFRGFSLKRGIDFINVCLKQGIVTRPYIFVNLQKPHCKPKFYQFANAELEIISRLAPVKLSGQTHFCSDTTHFWPDKYPLRHISIKSPPPPPHNVYISNKYIFYAFIVHAASNSMLERTVQPQSSAESILHLCIQLSLQFFVFYTVKF